MERVDRILEHPLFLEHLEKNNRAEADRIFCRHNMEHFLDVARIARILNLEEDCRVDSEWIYGAALLHDLGRHVQYEEGTPHEIPGAKIAEGILEDCGFAPMEREEICKAIRNHRNKAIREEKNLQGLLYRADKASRACFFCKAREVCDWKTEKKNLHIRY